MIQLTDLRRLYHSQQDEIGQAVNRVLGSGVYLFGSELKSFETEFANFLGVRQVVGLKSGTDALSLAVRSLGLEPEDEVIVPANSYPTAFGIASGGVKIALCDVDPDTLTMTPTSLLAAVTKKTRAAVVVHLYGMPAPMKGLMRAAKQKHLILIEDCAQAIGARIDNRPVGSFGKLACFSFYPTKNLGAFGDGGAIGTSSGRLAQKIRHLRMYGESRRYFSKIVSSHSRLDEIQSAILRVRLTLLSKMLRKRQRIASRYRKYLSPELLIPSQFPGGMTHAYHLFVIRVSRRNELCRVFRQRQVETKVHYPRPLHVQPAFRHLGYQPGDFPVTNQAARSILSIPLHQFLSEKQQDQVIGILNSWK